MSLLLLFRSGAWNPGRPPTKATAEPAKPQGAAENVRPKGSAS